MKRPRAADITPSKAPANASAAEATRRVIPRRSRRGGVLLMCGYILWAFVIPIKNVLMIETPTLRVDTVQTETTPYAFNTSIQTTDSMTGRDIVTLLQRVLSVVVGDRAIREQLHAIGSFDLDAIHHLLSPDDFQTLMLYYALVVQATEFPGAAFTPRPRQFASSSAGLAVDAMGLWIQPLNGSDPWLLTLSCDAQDAWMDGTSCHQNDSMSVCYDFPVVGETRQYHDVSLNASRNHSGFGNSIALLYTIEAFHATVDKLVNTKSWNKTLEGLQFVTSPTQTPTALSNGFSSVYRDGIPMILEKVALDSYALRVDELETTTLESCFISEIVALAFYIKAFVVDLVETTLLTIDGEPYGVGSDSQLLIPRDRINATVTPMLSQRVVLSSGARVNAAVLTTRTKIFTGLELTSITRATARLKGDKKLANTDALGSHLRMLLMMARYPEYYSAYRHTVERDSLSSATYDRMEFRLLGGAMSGLNTYKSDWWGNTMGVFKLAELPLDPKRTPPLDAWWDDEAKITAWFQRLEHSRDAPFYTLAEFIDIESTGVVLDDDHETRCHRAFYKTLTKIVWLSLLSASALPSYLVFMSNVNGARPWFVNMIKRFELVGETMNGERYAFPYSATSTDRKDDGSAWPMTPLLDAMVANFGATRAASMILAEFNASFALFTTTEYGLVHFPDSSQCKVGFQTNNVSADTNTIEKITSAFYPSVERFVYRALDDLSSLYTRMTTELAAEGVEMPVIPKEMLVGSPSTPRTIGFVGSPVFWRPTALTAGILKLWPAATPPSRVIAAYRNATVCYRTLELRYLNESTRCWIEPNSVTRSRVAYDAEGLRYLIWSNWSISWVLNAIALCIALQFVSRFVVAYRITRFRCVSFWVAAQLNFQSIGVLSYAQVLLMTLSSVPLMVAYHLPSDATFMEPTHVRAYPKILRDAIVALSATWFLRLGYDSVHQVVRIREVVPGVHSARLRLAAAFLVLALRVVTPDKLDDANYEMFKLLATCGIATALGVVCAAIPLAMHRRQRKIAPKSSMTMITRVTSARSSRELVKAENTVIQHLQDEGMALNHHGVLGFSRFYGWSLTALIVEGWEVVTTQSRDVVIAKGRCKIPLQVDDEHCVTQCLL